VLDHVSIRVADYDRSKTFYQAALAPLGYTLAMELSSGAGFRKAFIPDFCIRLSFRAERRRRGVEESSACRVEGSLPGRQGFLDSAASRLRSE